MVRLLGRAVATDLGNLDFPLPVCMGRCSCCDRDKSVRGGLHIVSVH